MLNTPSLDWTSGSVKSAHEMATPLRVLAISLQRASFLSMILTFLLSAASILATFLPTMDPPRMMKLRAGYSTPMRALNFSMESSVPKMNR